MEPEEGKQQPDSIAEPEFTGASGGGSIHDPGEALEGGPGGESARTIPGPRITDVSASLVLAFEETKDGMVISGTEEALDRLGDCLKRAAYHGKLAECEPGAVAMIAMDRKGQIKDVVALASAMPYSRYMRHRRKRSSDERTERITNALIGALKKAAPEMLDALANEFGLDSLHGLIPA